MTTFQELAASRREWIETVLKPWCMAAPLSQLRRAEMEWDDIAGRVDPEATLWTWAWSRFPDLMHEGISGVNETSPVCVTLKDSTTLSGFPDGRKSKRGQLFLFKASADGSSRMEELGPVSIDDMATVERIDDA